jgi:hypothetical protein
MRRIIIELDGGGEDVHLTVPSSMQAQAQRPLSQEMGAVRATAALDAGAAPSLTGAELQPSMAIPSTGADTRMLMAARGGGNFDAGAAPQSE